MSAVGLSAADKLVRATRVTASEAPAILGLSPWASPFDPWARILHGVERESSGELTVGTYLERGVADWWIDHFGGSFVFQPGRSVVHGEHDWLSATPDRIGCGVIDAGTPDEDVIPAFVLECKTSRTREGWGEPGTDQIPAYYACQVMVQLACTDLDHAEVAVLFKGEDAFAAYSVPRDEVVIAHIVGELQRWYEKHIVGKEMPPLDGGNAAAEFLRRKYPSNNGAMKTPTDAQTALVQEYRTAKGAESACKDVSAVLRQRLILEIGESDGFTLQDGEWLSFRADKRGRRSLRMSGQKDE